jgi:hypothetical protein
MALIQSKQISKLVAGKMYIADFNMASVDSPLGGVGVTDTLASAALTAGDMGLEVPVQSHLNGPTLREGFITTNRNLVELFDVNDQKFSDAGGNEVYGRLVQQTDSESFTGLQSAAWWLLTDVAGLDPNQANYVTKTDIVVPFTNAVTNYDISNPPGGRTPYETGYAQFLATMLAQATTLEADGAITKLVMHTTLTQTLESNSQFTEARGAAAASVITALGDDFTVFTNKADITTAIQAVSNAYDISNPIGARTATEQAHAAELVQLRQIAFLAEGDGALTVEGSYNAVIADAKASAAYKDGAFVVMFYSNSGGTEASYSFPISVDALTIKFVIPYLYTFEHLPFDFATGMKSVYVNDDPSSSSSSVQVEQITVTAQNAVDALAFVFKPATRSTIYVNGQVVLSNTAQYSIDAVTNMVVWNPVIAGYNLMPTDEVMIEYETTGAAFP